MSGWTPPAGCSQSTCAPCTMEGAPNALAEPTELYASSGVDHVWRLEGVTPGFFLQRQRAEGPVFSAFGYTWCMHLDCNTVCHNCEGYVTADQLGCFLRLLTKDTQVEVSATLSIGNRMRHLEALTVSTLEDYCQEQYYGEHGEFVQSPSDEVGFAAFIPRQVVVDNRDIYFPDGTLTLSVTLRDCTPARCLPISVPNPGLAAAFGCALETGLCADVTLVCADGEQLAAHALALSARSPVFAAQLAAKTPWAAGTLAAARPTVLVPPEITSHTLKRMLQFLYTDELTPESPEEATHLLNAADHYNVPRLFALCESTLYKALNVDNAANTLTLADQHGAEELKRVTLAWIVPRVASVIDTDGWRHLAKARPSLMQDLMLTMATGVPPKPTARDEAADGDKAAGSKRQRA